MTEEATSLAPDTEASEEVIPATENTEADGDSPTEGEQAEGEIQNTDDAEAEERKTRNQQRREAKKARQRREREELEKLQAQKAALQAAKTEEPKEDNFDDYEDYRAAKAVHMFHSSQTDAQTAQITEREKALDADRRAQVAKDFHEQCVDASQRYENFQQVAGTAPISDEVADLVAESEVGADIAYFLGSNPETAHEISGMSQLEAARALGRLEATLTAPQPKTQTAAPKPIDPVSGGIGAGKDPVKMSPAQYKAWRANGGTF